MSTCDSINKTTYSLLKAIVTLLTLFLFFEPISVNSQEYAIGDGDLLKITVYDHQDLATEVRVGNEGKISFPLIGEFLISGLTATEVEKKIAGRLADGYIMNPHVAVFISEYKSKKVTILGAVAKPGVVELRGNSTLLEVISNAGGLTQNAGDMLTVSRKVSEDNERWRDVSLTVDLRKLFEEGDIKANAQILDGDSVYVPSAALVYVNGEVKNPGAYKITQGLTVLKAITLSGGFTQKASHSKINILRKTGESEATIKANMDDTVRPDDVIMVPESFF